MICKSWGSILGKRERSPYRPGVLLGKIGVTAATAPKFWSCVKAHRLEKSSIGMFSILVGAVVGAVVVGVVVEVVGVVVIHTISVTWLVIVMFLTFTFLLMLTFVTKPSVLVKLNLEQYPSWLIGSLTIIV